MPERIQLSRRKGWRKPENTVVVSRPSKWGNPYTLEWAHNYWAEYAYSDAQLREAVVEHFNTDLLFVDDFDYPSFEMIRAELRGKNLACWCPLDQPCHADVLLEVANAAAVSHPKGGNEND